MVRITRESWSRKLMMDIRRRRESSALQRTARTLPLTVSSFRTAPGWGSASGARDPQAMSASKGDGKGTLRANICSGFPGFLAVDAASPPGSGPCCARRTRGAPPDAGAAVLALPGPPGPFALGQPASPARCMAAALRLPPRPRRAGLTDRLRSPREAEELPLLPEALPLRTDSDQEACRYRALVRTPGVW